MQRERGGKHPGEAVSGRDPAAAPLRPRDADAVAAMPDVVRIHLYEADWYNNATFVLPLLGAVGMLIAWGVTGSLELLGLGIFLMVVTLGMLPLVFLTWQRTPTAIIVRRSAVEALHQGRTLQRLAWPDVAAVRRVETMGNVRWYVLDRDGGRLAIEGEIEDVPALLEAVRSAAGLAQENDS